MQGWPLEVSAFPEYYEQYFKEAMGGGAVAPIVPMLCTGPIRYCGAEALKRDIENLKAAASSVKAHAVFTSANYVEKSHLAMQGCPVRNTF
jgi:5-methyltetrahydropteroyltriglutamate--homocysteine methyltransferase